jgi:PhnB protein
MEPNMQIHPYLSFNGNCEEAFKFYEQSLGGKIETIRTHEGMPPMGEVPPGWERKVLHARIAVGGTIIMGSDTPPAHYKQPQGVDLSIGVTDPAEADRVFNALAENGQVRMPIQKTFWARRFGMLIDRFGIPWMVNCE